MAPGDGRVGERAIIASRAAAVGRRVFFATVIVMDGSASPASVSAAVAPRAWRRAAAWLGAASPADPVERNNAAMMRWLLVFMGLYQPLVLLDAMWRPGAAPVAAAPALLNTAAMWICFLILRRGRLRLAAGLFVAVSLSLQGYGYLRWGLQAQAWNPLGQMLPVLVGGLVLSRRALWVAVACLVALMLLGAWRDAGAYLDPIAIVRVRDRALHLVLMLVAMAAVLDLAVASLRDSLDALRERNRELARTRDRLQLEMQARERSHEQLVHAQKMEAAGRLASGLAHDFNHLLTLIRGYAARGPRTDAVDELKAALAGVDAAARRATAVSRKLLDFSRHEPARPEPFDAGEALAQMRPLLRQLCPPAVALELEPPSSPRPVRLDRAQFELVLLNLAANAVQAMPDGGVVRIACAQAGPDWIEVAVADTGHGMTEDVRARCLEPFFTTRPSGQGTGLGLAVAANLIEAAGGGIAVESEPGRGSTFRIRVPRYPAD